MKMIILQDRNNNPIAINTDNILTIFPIKDIRGIAIEMIDKSQIFIPRMTIEEIVEKINQDTNIDKLGQMTTAICDRISHLEDAMAAGMQYIGRSCH